MEARLPEGLSLPAKSVSAVEEVIAGLELRIATQKASIEVLLRHLEYHHKMGTQVFGCAFDKARQQKGLSGE